MRIPFQKIILIIHIAVVLATFLFLPGCGFKDIDKRIFVVAIGVDHTDNEEKPFKIILKLALPTGAMKEAAGMKYAYLSREASSLAGAVRILKTHVDKELEFGHAKVIVLGEKVVNHHDLSEVIDLFIRRRDIQMISWVAIGSPSAEKILQNEPSSEMAGASILSNLFSGNGTESSYIVSAFLFDVRRRMLEKGIDPILPIIRASKDNKKLIVNRSMLFRNSKKATTLTPVQTKAFNMLSENIERAEIIVKEKDLEFAAAIETAKVKYNILTPPNKPPVLKLDVKMTGIIEESTSFELTSKDLDTYSKLTSKYAKKYILDFLKLIQKENVDPLGFGLRYKATRLHNRDTFAEWQRIYPEIKLDVTVDTQLKSTGSIE